MALSYLQKRRNILSVAVSLAVLVPPYVQAREVLPGQDVLVDGQTSPPADHWVVQPGGKLTFVNGAQAYLVEVVNGHLTMRDSSLVAPEDARIFPGVRVDNGSKVVLENIKVLTTPSGALAVGGRSASVGMDIPSDVTVVGSDLSGDYVGTSLNLNGRLDMSDTRSTGVGMVGTGFNMLSGTAVVRDGSVLAGVRAGVWLVRDWRGVPFDDLGRQLTIDNSVIRGGKVGILGETLDDNLVSSDVIMRNGSHLSAQSGIAIDMQKSTHLDLTVDASVISGDIQVADGASSSISMINNASLIGKATGNVSIALASGAVWNMTSESLIADLSMEGGHMRIGGASEFTLIETPYQNLTLTGNLGGRGGDIYFRTFMNEGGPLSSQFTDRLLIEGNVTTTGITYLNVTPTGDGALTDRNGNGRLDANEGVSLVQVAGNSYANAFALRGGYVAAGPWQYTLHAFGPGSTDPSQSVLASGTLNWDYRIGSAVLCEGGCPPEPPDPPGPDNPDPPGPDNPDPPGPDNPDPPGPPGPGVRPAVVPQLPSYLSAPVALFGYGDMLNSNLHQRLGDLRTGLPQGPTGGEVFARYLGGQLRYTPNRSFQDYGYAFDQQINALQLGGSLIAIDADTGTLRGGWAADHGTTRVTPKAADGASRAKYTGNGVSAWVTWEHGRSGLWVDGVVGSRRYQGDVGTDARGQDVARIRASGTTLSIEAGLPVAISDTWIVEPHLLAAYQQLSFRDFTDKDGLEIKLGSARQGSVTIGAMIARQTTRGFLPYARIDLVHTTHGDPWTNVYGRDWNLAERFRSGRTGNAYQVAAGMTAQLHRHVQLYAEGNYRHYLSGYGTRGWGGNVGLRVTF